MPDPSAAERAREVIEYALDCCPRDGRTAAEVVVDALLANPSLLAALAVEAGGMEQIETLWWSTEFPNDPHWYSVSRSRGAIHPGDEPVYRRVRGERDA